MANKRSSLNLEQRSPQLLHQQHILLAVLTLLDVCRAVYLREVTVFLCYIPSHAMLRTFTFSIMISSKTQNYFFRSKLEIQELRILVL